MEEEAPNPQSEFLMAIAGPATSVLILVLLTGLSVLGSLQGWNQTIIAVLTYLATVNGVLAIFNLVPAFPLDGGRVLRSALWAWKHNLAWATRITARLGGWFGGLLILLGLISIFQGELIGGIWWVILGFFLRQAAEGSYRQMLMHSQLEGEPIRRFMHTRLITVPPELTIRKLMERFFYQYRYSGYPVVEGDRLLGYISLSVVQNLPRSQWDRQTVRDRMTPIEADNSLPPEASAAEALAKMNRTGHSPLMITEQQHLRGLVSIQDLLRFVTVKTMLEQPD